MAGLSFGGLADARLQLAREKMGILGYNAETARMQAMNQAPVAVKPQEVDPFQQAQDEFQRYRMANDRASMLRAQGLGYRKGKTRITDPHGSPVVDTVSAKLADGEAVLNAGAASILGREKIADLNAKGLKILGLPEDTKPAVVNGEVHAYGGINFNDPEMRRIAETAAEARRQPPGVPPRMYGATSQVPIQVAESGVAMPRAGVPKGLAITPRAATIPANVPGQIPNISYPPPPTYPVTGTSVVPARQTIPAAAASPGMPAGNASGGQVGTGFGNAPTGVQRATGRGLIPAGDVVSQQGPATIEQPAQRKFTIKEKVAPAPKPYGTDYTAEDIKKGRAHIEAKEAAMKASAQHQPDTSAGKPVARAGKPRSMAGKLGGIAKVAVPVMATAETLGSDFSYNYDPATEGPGMAALKNTALKAGEIGARGLDMLTTSLPNAIAGREIIRPFNDIYRENMVNSGVAVNRGLPGAGKAEKVYQPTITDDEAEAYKQSDPIARKVGDTPVQVLPVKPTAGIRSAQAAELDELDRQYMATPHSKISTDLTNASFAARGLGHITKTVGKDGRVTYSSAPNPYMNEEGRARSDAFRAGEARVLADQQRVTDPKVAEAASLVAKNEDDAKLRAIRDKALSGEPEAIRQWNLLNKRDEPKYDVNIKAVQDALGTEVVTNGMVEKVRNPEMERKFFKWMAENGIRDTNKGLAMWLANESPDSEQTRYKAFRDQALKDGDTEAVKRADKQAKEMGLAVYG